MKRTVEGPEELRSELHLIMERLKSGHFELIIPPLVQLWKRIPDTTFHVQTEVFFQLSGTTQFQFPQDQIELNPGQILIIPPGVPHGEIGENKDEIFESIVFTIYHDKINCHFGHLVWNDAQKKMTPERGYTESVNLNGSKFYSSMIKQIIDFDSSSNQRDNSASHALLTALVACVTEILGSEPLSSDTMEIHPKVEQISEYVEHQLSCSDLTVKSIAKHLRMAPDYLSHLYHQKTGERLTCYVNRRRLEEAKILLRESELNISEVAWACGYNEMCYFSRLFKTHFGLSPSRYRQSHLTP